MPADCFLLQMLSEGIPTQVQFLTEVTPMGIPTFATGAFESSLTLPPSTLPFLPIFPFRVTRGREGNPKKVGL